MIWEIDMPWNRINETSKYGISKTANPVRIPTKVIREILGKEVSLKITDKGKVMHFKITY